MWTYGQSTGRMYDPDGELAGEGYSGSLEGKNLSAMQNVHNVGPIPRGWYTMQPPVNSHTHGPYAIALVPDITNMMFGRDAFMIHGDSLVNPGHASEGCIILPHAARVAMWESHDPRVLVVEGYDE